MDLYSSLFQIVLFLIELLYVRFCLFVYRSCIENKLSFPVVIAFITLCRHLDVLSPLYDLNIITTIVLTSRKPMWKYPPVPVDQPRVQLIGFSWDGRGRVGRRVRGQGASKSLLLMS